MSDAKTNLFNDLPRTTDNLIEGLLLIARRFNDDSLPMSELLIKDAVERIKELEQLTTWQPIETAPATPAAILLLTTSGSMKIETGHWAINMVNASKVDGDDCFYTHWMPLPKPPAIG